MIGDGQKAPRAARARRGTHSSAAPGEERAHKIAMRARSASQADLGEAHAAGRPISVAAWPRAPRGLVVVATSGSRWTGCPWQRFDLSGHVPPRHGNRRCTSSMCGFELEPGAQGPRASKPSTKPAQTTAERARIVSARESFSSDAAQVGVLVVRASGRGKRGASGLASSAWALCTLQRCWAQRTSPATGCHPSVLCPPRCPRQRS